MTTEELEEQINELVEDYLMTNDEDVEISVNMQMENKWVSVNFHIEIEEL